MKNKNILIYGANGYTGKLFAKYLIKQGIKPILAGRRNTIKQTGSELGCEARVFSVEESEKYLADIDAVVNLAGPFANTQNGLIEGCLKTQTHYVDIAGEVPELQNAYSYDEAAKEAGIVLLPAAGFGVVPTDIAAKLASEQLDTPVYLSIAYATVGGASRGTLKTVLKDIHKPGVIVQNGRFEEAMPASRSMDIEVQGKKFKAVYNPWRADLFTAGLSTGIPNIETYSEFPSFVVSMMKGKLGWLRNLILKRLINWMPEGPNEKQLKTGKTYIKATATNNQNKKSIVELVGPEAYQFTVISLKEMLELIFQTDLRGMLTPSMLDVSWILNMERVDVKTTTEN